MQAPKAALNETKVRQHAGILTYLLYYSQSKLDAKDLRTWKGLTKFTNQTGTVVAVARDRFRTEMCTNAFVKMLEMLATQHMLPVEHGPVTTVHVCEAPGAFIAATNHYLRQQFGAALDWEWTALSLNPYYEGNDLAAMIDDDAFILNTLPHWYFGADNSGNIMHRANIEGLWTHVRASGRTVQLVTGDGSIDCSSSPNEQESVVAALHFAEAVAALGLLAPGGAAVLKLFTLFEHESICLMYLLRSLFNHMSVHKPATSTQGNSEVYLLLRGFRGCPAPLLDALLAHVTPSLPNHAMLPRERLPPAFVDEARTCAARFADWTRVVIERNLDLEQRKTRDEDHAIRRCRNEVAEEFIRRCSMRAIDPGLRIVTRTYLSGAYNQLNTGEAVGAEFGKNKDGGGKQGDLQARQANRDDRREYLAGRKHGRDDDDGDRASVKSSRSSVASAAVPVYSSAAQHMMGSMGAEPGRGLGAAGTGMLQPLQPVALAPQAGLGAQLPALPSFDVLDSGAAMPSVAGEPFFDDSDGFEAAAQQWMSNPRATELAQRSLEELNRDGWIVTAATPLPAVILSKFCREKAIQRSYEVREAIWPTLLELPAAELALLESKLFATSTSLQAELGVSRTAVQLTHLNALFGFAAGTDAEQLHGLDLSHTGASPMLEFLSVARTASRVTGFTAAAAKDNCTYAIMQDIEVTSADEFAALSGAVTAALNDTPVQIVFVDACVDSAHQLIGNRGTEALVKRQLFCDVLLALRALSRGAWLVIKIGDCLTRATVGLLHLLYCVFEGVQRSKPWSCPAWLPERFVVCRGYIGDGSAYLAHLDACVRQLLVHDGQDVLALAPMRDMLSPGFFRAVTLANERFAHREVSAAMQLQWALDHGPVDVAIDAEALQQQVQRIRRGYQAPAVPALQPVATVYSRFVRASEAPASDVPPIQPAPAADGLPPNWTRVWSNSRSMFYFYNTVTGATTWDQPAQ